MADATAPEPFRWQRFFQRSRDPVFLINRWRRLLFVNRSWEQLTRRSWADVRGRYCKRHRNAEAGSIEALLTALAPAAEVRAGQAARVRRLFTSNQGPQWWTIDFLPLQGKSAPLGVLGTIHAEAQIESGALPPLPERLVALRERLRVWHGLDRLDSTVPAVQRLTEQARLAGQINSPALLVGEPGTGKHWLARSIHQLSARRELPFAALACDALPPSALSAVIFGDVLGRRPNLGTIYLHEIAALPGDLQERLCQRLTTETAAGPRWLAGTSGDPMAAVNAGQLMDELLSSTLGS